MRLPYLIWVLYDVCMTPVVGTSRRASLRMFRCGVRDRHDTAFCVAFLLVTQESFVGTSVVLAHYSFGSVDVISTSVPELYSLVASVLLQDFPII